MVQVDNNDKDLQLDSCGSSNNDDDEDEDNELSPEKKVDKGEQRGLTKMPSISRVDNRNIDELLQPSDTSFLRILTSLNEPSKVSTPMYVSRNPHVLERQFSRSTFLGP